MFFFFSYLRKFPLSPERGEIDPPPIVRNDCIGLLYKIMLSILLTLFIVLGTNNDQFSTLFIQKAIGGKWGFSSNIADWLYNLHFCQKLNTYILGGSLVDRTGQIDKLKQAIKFQRSVSMCISDPLR